MKDELHLWTSLARFRPPNTRLAIQAPLPGFLHTLPILLSIPGRGTARERAAPLAPPGSKPNDS